MNFSEQNITNLKIPKKGIAYYHDNQEKGLSLYITSNRIVTFFIRKAVNGKNARIKIGRFPEITAEEAREKAKAIKILIAHGENPIQNKQSNLTFGHIFQEYMEKYSKKEKQTWEEDERELRVHLFHWIDRKASIITKKDVEELHRKISETRKHKANRVLARISSVYNKAIEWGHKLENPAKGIKKNKETARDRYLQKNEIKALLQSLKEETNTIIRDYVLISLLTGARQSNVCSMEWKYIDFHNKLWMIPQTKNGDSLYLPLTDKVIEILHLRKLDNEELGFSHSKYVFPGKGKTGHLVEPKKAWKKILERAGIEDLRLHDLRRTFGSIQAIQGSSLLVIGKSLGHRDSKSTEIYAKLSVDSVRESIDKLADFIFDKEE